MQRCSRSLVQAICFSCLVPFAAGYALARQTVVTGAVGTSYDYRDRTYDQKNIDDDDEGDVQKISIGPTIEVVSTGVYNTLNLRYSPKLAYDFVDDDNEVDQLLNASSEHRLTKDWSLTLLEDFIYSDDPDSMSASSEKSAANGSSGVLSRDISGRQYWTNTAGVRTSYALMQDTRIDGGYKYSVLRNEQGGNTGNNEYDEYDRHTLFTDLTHRFTPHWQSNLGMNYTRGLYNDEATSGPASTTSPDLDEYGANIGIDYLHSVRDSFPVKYSVSATQYDGETRRDSEAHEWSAGWEHAFDPRMKISLGGGPSYAKTQGLDGQWGYNAYFSFMKQYEHAFCSLQFDKRYEFENFSGTDESGLQDTYNARANFTYQHTQALSFDVFGRYSWQSQLDPQGDYRAAANGSLDEQKTGDLSYDKDVYQAGLGMKYTFSQWYTAGVKYVYYVSDGELDSDQYTDHQVLFTLSASKELWRW
jgi:hypothetical protein